MADDWNWVGARWWKFDFHTHTPASEDYGKGPNQAQLKLIGPKDWLLSFMRAGIDCVAVTDHNSFDELEEAHSALEAAKDLESEVKALAEASSDDWETYESELNRAIDLYTAIDRMRTVV